MCGRYSFDDLDEIYEVRGLLEQIATTFGEDAAASVKTGEVCPTDTAAVLAQTKSGNKPQVMSWGYPMYTSKRPLINARSETIADKPVFAKSLMTRKCLIPCTGFFEWKALKNRKQKYKISLRGERFFYLAGLYNVYKIKGLYSARFVIVTAPANDQMKDIHHRMPLIVPKHSTDTWLTDRTVDIGEVYRSAGVLEKKTV